MKASRHETILEIVKSCQVETQEMLREMLLERGIKRYSGNAFKGYT